MVLACWMHQTYEPACGACKAVARAEGYRPLEEIAQRVAGRATAVEDAVVAYVSMRVRDDHLKARVHWMREKPRSMYVERPGGQWVRVDFEAKVEMTVHEMEEDE